MTPKEYLKQAHRLNEWINAYLLDLKQLKSLSSCISSPSLGERVQTTRNFEAPFVKQLEKIWELEEKINRQIDKLIDLKQQIQEVIQAVDDADERMVLQLRHVNGWTWQKIGDELRADGSTVHRWHARALKHVTVPDDAIII